MVNRKHGLTAAKDLLRHADIQITAMHYVDSPRGKRPAAWEPCSRPTPSAKGRRRSSSSTTRQGLKQASAGIFRHDRKSLDLEDH